MKKLMIICWILFGFTYISGCKSQSHSDEGKNRPSTVADNSDGPDNFSCLIDGKLISGIVQYPGVLKPQHKMGTVDFKTRDNKDTINLSFPNVVGVKTVDLSKFDEQNEYYHLVLAINDTSYMYQVYTVTISQISDSRVKGTFSGVAKAYNSPKTIKITEGKFDIPMQGRVND